MIIHTVCIECASRHYEWGIGSSTDICHQLCYYWYVVIDCLQLILRSVCKFDEKCLQLILRSVCKFDENC